MRKLFLFCKRSQAGVVNCTGSAILINMRRCKREYEGGENFINSAFQETLY